jgi:hypothetical protein
MLTVHSSFYTYEFNVYMGLFSDSTILFTFGISLEAYIRYGVIHRSAFRYKWEEVSLLHT